MRKIGFFICLFQLAAFSVYSDGTDEDALDRILKDAVTIAVHSEIILHADEKYWESDVNKVTVPGRTVTLLYQTESEKLAVELTPFIAEDNSYMLTAMSKFWHEDHEGAQFRSSFKSINLQKGELVLFYPLGQKTQEALTGGNLFMEMSIRILPYERKPEDQAQ